MLFSEHECQLSVITRELVSDYYSTYSLTNVSISVSQLLYVCFLWRSLMRDLFDRLVRSEVSHGNRAQVQEFIVNVFSQVWLCFISFKARPKHEETRRFLTRRLTDFENRKQMCFSCSAIFRGAAEFSRRWREYWCRLKPETCGWSRWTGLRRRVCAERDGVRTQTAPRSK